MGFLGNLASEAISDLTHSNSSSNPPPPEPYYEPSSGGPPGPPPRLFAPWIARWDDAAGRWFFINEANGERTFEYPGGGDYYQGGSAPGYGGNGGYGGGGGGYGCGGFEERPPPPREDESSGGGHSGLAYGAMGVAAGVAGGALLMHEGDEIAQDWDADKARLERGISDVPDSMERGAYDTAEFIGEGVGDVERGADRAGDWTERKWDGAVEDVEEIPDDVERGVDETAEIVGEGVGDVERGADEAGEWTERKWDDAVQDVEDIPGDVEDGVEGAAEWVGEGVGEVERFGDGVEASYDEGREEGYED